MTVHEQAVDAAMEIECKKDSLRQNQDGTWKLVLTVAPDGLPDAIMKAPPGVRYRAFFVEVDDNEQPVKHEKPKKRFHEMPLSQQAALRCDDMRFQDFLADTQPERWGLEVPEAGVGFDFSVAAANIVRLICRVGSRAEFDTNPAPAAIWKSFNAEYESWAGHTAEMR